MCNRIMGLVLLPRTKAGREVFRGENEESGCTDEGRRSDNGSVRGSEGLGTTRKAGGS